jgi:6-pyruvoyltetrahydropterin/6-carboxytetrahydropterin synthase
MWELTKSFRFEAAHAISGTALGSVSEEVHGHSYRAEVTIRGVPHSETGMIVDTGMLEQSLGDVRRTLDHRFLNHINDLGPPTLENLARFIWDRVQHVGTLARVTVHRDSCNESCTYFGPEGSNR